MAMTRGERDEKALLRRQTFVAPALLFADLLCTTTAVSISSPNAVLSRDF